MIISVIVPLYKGHIYMERIIATMRKNAENISDEYQLELVFVNDYPEELIELEENKNGVTPNFRCILVTNSFNQGIHMSRVNGLENASGEYVTFLDQDDIISDHYFASQLRVIRRADVVVANGMVQYPGYDKYLYKYRFMQWTVKHIWFYVTFNCRIISPGQCLIKRSSIPEEWKKNIIRRNGADDYFLWLLMLLKRNRFEVNRERIYTHVYTNENSSLDTNEMRESREEVFTNLTGIMDIRYMEKLRKSMFYNKKSFLIFCIEWLNGAK